MVALCVFVGLGLALCGVILACATGRGRDGRPHAPPPPLPPRSNVDMPPPIISRPPARLGRPAARSPLPPRRSFVSATADATQMTVGGNRGPRGVRPTQFPCCPYDKQRNILGERQVIFWDSGEGCYRCSRGHRFKANGKIL